MSEIRLIQIPFSHNCIKVRLALERKGIPYAVENIPPADRRSPRRASGQGLVPVLLDGGRAVSDSTAILLHLEQRFPEPALLPRDPALRAECLVLEDWADERFMAMSRRIAYFHVLSRPGLLGRMFFPDLPAWRRALQERLARRVVVRRFRISASRHALDLVAAKGAARLAVDRLAGRAHLLGGGLTLADLALATMSAPLAADAGLAADPAVAALLAWDRSIVGAAIMDAYTG
ncbi:MAG TPA: glutathione S-transferase family protein [Candidatus Polarisedimenticolaceae bacterium]